MLVRSRFVPLLWVFLATAPIRASAAPLRDASLLITAPDILEQLESRGLALHRLLGAGAANTAAMHATSALYREFAALVATDDSVAKWKDPKAGVGFAPSHRLFDIAWLTSARTYFELTGVINRADRKFATPGRCGEVRFVFRLAYQTARVQSRVPLTVSLVYLQGADCARVAQRWLALEQRDRTELAGALLTGPLQDRGAPVRIEINFQSGRWPSALRPALGGHAEYVLRSFEIERGHLVRSTLESTPTQKLGAAARARLRSWIAANLAGIDAGEVVLPREFLAERSVSVQPRGIARLANRAFSQIVPAAGDALPAAALRDRVLVRSRAGLLRRLDQLTCKGCHASRSLAGFHLLGEDRNGAASLNAVAVGLSPHLLAQLPWRRSHLEALAHGTTLAAPRPFADRGSGLGLAGESCGLGDPSFAAWKCAAGLYCRDVHGDRVGACTARGGNGLGDGVESGKLTQERDALRDTMLQLKVEPCRSDWPNERAARSKNGFPGGMCHAPCPVLGDRVGDAICGPLPFGRGTEFDGFTSCIARQHPFERCLADDMHPTWLRACDRDTPCRDDYLCVRVPVAADALKEPKLPAALQPSAANEPEPTGACVPPYFLFQVRVDGHFPERW